jgi:anaerobic sulfite reductase subunit C
MDWTAEAEKALKKVPFFVRKRVRAQVEKEAVDAGCPAVGLPQVQATQRRYLNNMESEIRGFQLDGCFGPSGCPNRAVVDEGLMPRLLALLEEEDLLGFLKQSVAGKLRFHHEFRVTVADCPNACSHPQIKDIGIIGACAPQLTEAECSGCEACVAACGEGAIALPATAPEPRIDMTRCLACGKCMTVCPTGTLTMGARGYRVLLGGKLGRHPRLAQELPGIFAAEAVLGIVRDCIALYKRRSRNGARFADIITLEDIGAYGRDGAFP